MLLASASAPVAMFRMPLVFPYIASYPEAVLLLPVVSGIERLVSGGRPVAAVPQQSLYSVAGALPCFASIAQATSASVSPVPFVGI